MPGPGCTGPFARFSGMQDCIDEQIAAGHDKDSAGAICQSIAQRASKGMLFKAIEQGLNIISKGDELVVGGYSTWELRDPQDDIITTKAQVGFLRRFFALPREYRNITVKHSDFKIGEPLLKYTVPSGETFYTHVNEIGTYLVSKIRNDNFKTTALWREAILKGELSMYSISGLPLEWEIQKDGARRIDDLEPWAVTLCEHGVNPKAKVGVIAKDFSKMSIEEMKDKLMGLYRQRDLLNKILYPPIKPDEATVAEVPIKQLPEGEKQEVSRELNLLNIEIYALEDALKKKIAEVYKSTNLKKSFVDLLNRLQKMTWEECIAEASKDPDVDDPEKLCGWLKHHGPNAKAETKGTLAPTLDLEMILQKHGFGTRQVVDPGPILKSASCDTSRCHGACCTFITDFSSRTDPDFLKYMRMHGVETKPAPNGTWLKLPVKCLNLDPVSCSCKSYDARPDLCRQYPKRPSPWISKEQCPLQP